MHASTALVSDAFRISFVSCPLRKRKRSAPLTRSFTRAERSKNARSSERSCAVILLARFILGFVPAPAFATEQFREQFQRRLCRGRLFCLRLGRCLSRSNILGGRFRLTWFNCSRRCRFTGRFRRHELIHRRLRFGYCLLWRRRRKIDLLDRSCHFAHARNRRRRLNRRRFFKQFQVLFHCR